MRELCLKCLRPASNCFCRFLRPFDPGVKFVILIHPKEAKKQRTGTGRLAHIGLLNSEIIMGIDFTKNERLCELLADPRYYPMLLYPGDDAWNATKEGFKEALGDKIPLVIVIDSTWFCSKKMISSSSNIMALPKLSFHGNYRSIFTFKNEPSPECVSTIESCYYLNRELMEAGITSFDQRKAESLMDSFKEMIKFQLKKENDRVAGLIPNTHAHDFKYTKVKEIPAYLG